MEVAEEAKYPDQEVRINRFNFFVFTTTYFYTFCFFVLGLHVIGRSQVSFIILYSFIPYITYKEKYDLARVMIGVCIVSQLLLIAYLG